jgi:hypothetical protein
MPSSDLEKKLNDGSFIFYDKRRYNASGFVWCGVVWAISRSSLSRRESSTSH